MVTVTSTYTDAAVIVVVVLCSCCCCSCCSRVSCYWLFVLAVVFANGLKTARVVKLIFHTFLWGARTHTNTRVGIWKMGTRGVGLGGRGGWVGASDVHVV